MNTHYGILQNIIPYPLKFLQGLHFVFSNLQILVIVPRVPINIQIFPDKTFAVAANPQKLRTLNPAKLKCIKIMVYAMQLWQSMRMC